jgi:hypothetical protein
LTSAGHASDWWDASFIILLCTSDEFNVRFLIRYSFS